MKKSSIIFFILVLGCGLLLVFPPKIFTLSQTYIAAFALLLIVLWSSTIIPEYITALLFFNLAMLFSLAPAEQVFSGFSSSAFWLVFGGLIIGIAINSTGLGKRVAILISNHLEGSYLQLISGVVLIGVLFSFLMPSAMARIVLIIPIILLVASHFGFKHGSNGHTGIVLAATMGAFIPAFSILPANVANMILAGMYEAQFNQSFFYGEYLILHFPVLGLLKAISIIALVLWLYPDQVKIDNESDLKNKSDWKKNEKLLLVLLIIALSFWISDFLHHIAPAWIAMAVAIVLLFPKIAIVSKTEFNQHINYSSLFFIAGIIGFGMVISHSGVGSIIINNLLEQFPLNKEHQFINYMILVLSALSTSIFTTIPGAPAVLSPLAEQLSQATGLPVKTVLMTQIVGYSTTLFPYQAPPIIIAMQLSGEKLITAFKFCLLLALISILFLIPINFLWWEFLNWT
jgi:anion transporter